MKTLPFRGTAVTATVLALALLASCTSPTDSGGGRNVARMDVVGGDLQTAKVGTELPQVLVVRVLNDKGKPVSGQIVNFVVTTGGGSVFAGTSQTDADGEARERWTLGTVAGDTQRVEVRAVNPTTGAAQVFATFRAVATPDVPASVARTSNLSLQGTSGTPLADSVAVKVSDRYGNGVPGVEVTWAARAGDGSFSPATTVTNAQGVTRSSWTLGAPGAAQATATVAGLPPVQLSALVSAGPPTRVQANVDSLSFTALRQTGQVSGTAYDQFGNALSNPQVRWMSLDTAVVQVGTFDGSVTAWGVGTGRLVAYAEGTTARDTVTVRVRQVPVSLTIEPRPALAGPRNTAVGDSIKVYVTNVRDANGYEVANPELVWTSSNPAVAQVGPTGYFVPLQNGTFTATVTAGTATASVPVEVRPTRTAASIVGGGGSICLLQQAADGWCLATFMGDDGFTDEVVIPGNPVDGAVGSRHGCFLLASKEAYCAGSGDYGQLGDGRYQRQPGDTAGSFGRVTGGGIVRGGLKFISLAVGGAHSCGVAEGGVLYCWGLGNQGQLGSGVRLRELDPTPVTGSETLRFTSVYAEGNGTCALSTQGSVYCWGVAGGKNLGSTPTAVQPPRAFTQLSMGGDFVCGLDPTGRAWCWGTSTRGELGNGVTAGTWDTAQPVLGDNVFTQIESGVVHTCALTAEGRVFCWGASGVSGKVQSVFTHDPEDNAPRPLHEERRFKDLSASSGFTCVLSLRDITLCWGQQPAYKDSGQELHPSPL